MAKTQMGQCALCRANKELQLRQHRTNNIRRDNLSILGINVLAFLAIGTAIASKIRLFIPKNRRQFSLDNIVRHCLKNAQATDTISERKVFRRMLLLTHRCSNTSKYCC